MRNNKSLEEYYEELDRAFFMDESKELARFDKPFSIGYGQTISQPSLVLFMTQQLELKKNDRVLEIGTGSGYQTALLAEFSNAVYTVERIKPLLERAKEKLDQLGFNNIHYILGDGTYGNEEDAPYDKIIVTAATCEIPFDLLEQLNIGGRMVIPVGTAYVQDLLLVVKSDDENIEVTNLEAVRFVPLVGDCSI